MVGVYRCSCGHTWKTASNGDPCPACGVTAPAAADATPQDQTRLHLPSSATDPSFSSLAGERDRTPDLYAVTRDVYATSEEPTDINAPTHEFAASPVPGYEIFEEIGRGGMGVVYRANQNGLNRPVALKMILAGSHAGPVERERFRREAQAVAALQHPHIVQIFEIGEANGHPYLALELVEGGSLAQHLNGQPWPVRDSAELVEVLARAVEYAHTQGIVHRDLKPGNILLSRERALPAALQSARSALPKITDFGLAKRIDETVAPDGATKTGAVMGTPSYIAPEQASGKTREIGPGVDVYALGAILYELLTGRPPFRGETPLDTVLQVINEDPVSPKSLQPNVPWDLQTICLKCLVKSPSKRYSSALVLAEDLRRYLNGEPILARPLSTWGRSVKWARRHPALAVLGAATVAATVALVSVLSVAYARVREAVHDKELEAEAAQAARAQEEIERKRAQGLAAENELARQAAVAQTEQLKRESERNRRGAYALQIAQIAAMSERDPKRAQTLLEDPARCPTDLRDFAWAYLHRLCLREDRIYAEHAKGDSLEAVAGSRGGTFVATAGARGEIRIWDPRTARTFAILSGHQGRIHGLAFSPDGGVLASAGADGTVRLWEFPADMLDLARRTMSALTFLQDIVKPFQLQPALTLTIIPRKKGDAAMCVAFSPEGRFLVAGFSMGVIRYWALDGWRPNSLDVAMVGGTAGTALSISRPSIGVGGVSVLLSTVAVRSIAFSPLGTMFAAGYDDKKVTLLIAEPGRTSRLPTPEGHFTIRTLDRHADAVTAMTFTPDEKTLITVNNGPTPAIRLIDTQTWKEDRRLIGHTGAIQSLAVSPDGTMLVSGGNDHTVRLWDLEEGRERATLLGHDREVHGVAFGADRKTVISAGGDGVARVWLSGMRPNESAELTPYRDGSVTAVSLDGSGVTLIFADGAGHVGVRLVDAPFGRLPAPGTIGLFPLAVEIPVSPVQTVAASPKGGPIFAAHDGAILVWRSFHIWGRKNPPAPGTLLIARPATVPIPKPIHAMVVDPDGKHLATLDADGLRVWETLNFPLAAETKSKHPTPPEIIFPAGGALTLTFHPKGDRLAIAIGNGVKVIDLTGKVVADQPEAHAARIEALAFDPEGTQLATADAAGLIKVWRVTPEGGLAHQANLSGHTGAVTTVSFTPGGRTLASGGVDRTIVLWDPLTGQERLVLTGHADRLVRVQFTTDGQALLSVSRDGSVKRWQAGERPAVRELPRFPFLPGPRSK